MTKKPRCYETLPPDYYPKRARQHVNWPLHFIGRKLLSAHMRYEQGPLTVVVPDSVKQRAKIERPVIVTPTHRSWLDIGIFVEATERAGLHHVRPMSKIENIQTHPLAAWFFHQVGLFAVDRGEADFEGINTVFEALYERGQHGLIFPEGTRVKEDVERIGKIARTPAMMALKYGFDLVPLAIVGASEGETQPSKLTVHGKHLPVATAPVAQFGDVIYVDQLPFDTTDKQLMLATGALTRSLRESMQQTTDAAYRTRSELLLAA